MYVRKVKKAGKVYLYYYKSQRSGNQVKSIYVGKVLEKPKKSLVRKSKNNNQNITKNLELTNNLIEFDNLLFEINRLISVKDLKSSINLYNKMFNIYSGINIEADDKQKLFDKLNSTYKELLDLSKEQNISILE